MQCTRCRKEEFAMSLIWKDVVDEVGHAKYEDYCFDCGIEELKKALKGVPFTIEVPYYPEYTSEELLSHGAAINYIAELIDYPPHK